MRGKWNGPAEKALLVALAAVTILGCQSANDSRQSGSSGSIKIKGSDTMVNLCQSWAEQFMDENARVFVAITGGGSGTGIAAMINGTTDIAASSRAMKEEEMAAAQKNRVEPVEFKVSLDGLAVVVNPSNPVEKLSLDQLRDIFMGTVTNWKQVGGRNGSILVLSRESNSGTHVYFKEHVLRRGKEKGPEEFARSALLMPSSQAIADEVATNLNAIGYYGLGYVSDRQKAIAMAANPGEPGVLPSVETIQKGTYPISRPLFLYTRGEPAGVVKAFMDFVLGDEGQRIVLDLDFVPLAE
ncbi:MAG: PstS family phosphate ABC transporter substrate-binding protein [Chloroflexi bacterium]|nr:PstS family phosphate ABC transporter substrate-binding protein [Chloroflexota bacterium]